ncbi:MAG: DMT family transporter [Kiloniellaceae bacterium]
MSLPAAAEALPDTSANGLRNRRSPGPALLPLLLVLAVGSLLGVTAVIAKAAALAGWPPLALLAWSNLGAAAIQLACTTAAGRRFNTTAPYRRYYLISGLLFALPNALAFGAAQHVGAGIVALCFAFPLILTYGLALGFGLERLQGRRLAGVLLGLGGALTIALSGGAPGSGLAVSPWLLAALSAPAIIAVGNIYRSLHWPKGADGLELSPGMLLVGGLSLLLALLAGGAGLAPAAWDTASLAFLAGQTAIFALLYLLYFMLQKLAGPVYLSQIGSVGALVGITLATVVLAEPLTAAIVIAGALVAAGILLVNRGAHRAN